MLASGIGTLFQPLFEAFAWVLAFFYAWTHNYALAITLLTTIVMIATAPLTVKAMRVQVAMQKLQPEMKKLQAKYKDDRVTLNQEMIKLQQEHGVNMFGGCLPMLLQMPLLLCMYDTIRGLTHTVTPKGTHTVDARPLYIAHHTQLYTSLVSHPGKMPAFGLNLSNTILTHGLSSVQRLPYILVLLVAIGLQYLQMAQVNRRNKGVPPNPQMQMMTRVFPAVMAIIYIKVSLAVNTYIVVSAIWRILIQYGAYKSGTLEKQKAGKAKRPGLMARLAEAQQNALEQQRRIQGAGGTAGTRYTSALGPEGSGLGGTKVRRTGVATKERAGGEAEEISGDAGGSGGARPRGAGAGGARRASAGPGAGGSSKTRASGSRSKDKRPRKAR